MTQEETFKQEEAFVRQHDGGRSPFKTPDGYFEGFTERLMARIGEQQAAEQKAAEQRERQAAEQQAARVVRLPLWRRSLRYAAAVAVAAVVLGGVGFTLGERRGNYGGILGGNGGGSGQLLDADAAEYAWETDEIDEVFDYEMLDNQQIAYYLTEAYY